MYHDPPPSVFYLSHWRVSPRIKILSMQTKVSYVLHVSYLEGESIIVAS